MGDEILVQTLVKQESSRHSRQKSEHIRNPFLNFMKYFRKNFFGDPTWRLVEEEKQWGRLERKEKSRGLPTKTSRRITYQRKKQLRENFKRRYRCEPALTEHPPIMAGELHPNSPPTVPSLRSLHSEEPRSRSPSRATPPASDDLDEPLVAHVGKVTRNPFLNFLRDFRRQCAGQPSWLVAVKGAREWNNLDVEQKHHYVTMARQAPKVVYRRKATRRRGHRHRKRRSGASKHHHRRRKQGRFIEEM